MIALLSWYWFTPDDSQQAQSVSYTEFRNQVRADKVAAVTLRGDQVSGTLKKAPKSEGAGQSQPPVHFVTMLPSVQDPGLMPLLDKHGVDVTARSDKMSVWLQVALGLLPWVLILGFIWYAGRKMQQRLAAADGSGGIFGFSRSRARRFRETEPRVTFDDVAGLENAKRDLREITGFLKEPERYRRLGAKIPKGILLMGPPGTGKTLLARAVAGEAKAAFFSVSGSEFIEMFVGVGASRVRDMFENAKRKAPAIIFIDEIDSVGRARGTGLGGGHDEREQTLNQILGEMDGFSPHETVVVLASTNRPDVLDPALLRPGRFDRKVTLDLPDRKARRAIVEIHCRDVPLADDVELDRLAALTVSFSGADLENLVNEAALLAGRNDQQQVTMEILLRARDKVALGAKREMVISDEEKRLIACHEAGHAVAASLLPEADPLDKVTIIPRGRALGVTEQIPEEERHNLNESYLRDRIGVMLGGRVAERLIFGETSSGSEEDLKQATRLARRMVAQWGMSDKLGPLAFRRGEENSFLGRELTRQRDFSEHTAQMIDAEMGDLVRSVEHRVTELLQQHRTQLEALADALLESETLDSREIQVVMNSVEQRRVAT
jgi:cell division protease FtsH